MSLATQGYSTRVYAMSPLSIQCPAACGWCRQLSSRDIYWRYTETLKCQGLCVGKNLRGRTQCLQRTWHHLNPGSKEKRNKPMDLPLSNCPTWNLCPQSSPQQLRTLFWSPPKSKTESSHSGPNPTPPPVLSDNLDKAADNRHTIVKGHWVSGIFGKSKYTIVSLTLEKKLCIQLATINCVSESCVKLKN